ncbi:unnamed protein product [Phaedon cochleariae]|uniref:U3 small nucleolar RNA-associated protein 25 homolog n=1 Tax=Phaedon cochleariae TaxID=80249 RepID=A0A9N9X0G7_PHACE|nr:unnamed protein product [Phaedon cochleariae]
MARRGKLKFKDVVKKPHGQKGQSKKKPKKQHSRKTYSLFDNKKSKPKRKFHSERSVEEPDPKKIKNEVPPAIEESSSSDEETAPLDSLRNTFTLSRNTKKSSAIDSSESEDENEDEVEKNSTEADGESEIDSEIDDDGMLETSSGGNDQGNISEEESDLEDKQSEKTDTESESSEIEVDTEADIDEVDNTEDPFIKHIAYDLHDSMLEALQSTPVSLDHFTETWSTLGKLSIQIPKCDSITLDGNSTQDSTFSIVEKKMFAAKGIVPKSVSKSSKPSQLFIKTQIINNLGKLNKKATGSENLTSLQAEIFSVINNYQDFCYSGRTFSNSEEIRFVYCVHAVNHILKTRLKVIHHNARLSKKDDVPEEFRDQGLVRPKVLIIVPFKDAAYKIVQMLIDLILPQDKGNVMNKLRFIEDYTGNELIMPKKNPKPEDYELTFHGNTNDDFKMGITVTKKSLKLYAEFYSSDIIIASPLGLRTIIGAEGEPDRDYDFLASIELLILDQTELFLMQNWDHVVHIFNHMHLQPKDSHGTDFSRVRTWSLNGWAKYYRQTLIFSSIALPEINSIFNKKCHNYAGKVRVINPSEVGCINRVVVQVPHVFHRFECSNAAEAIDARFDFFVSKILPQQRESLMKQTLIFVPSYFDYVRVRNYFKKEDIGFVQICEYSKEGKVARARDMFFHGDAHFLLYTERYHFFNRKRIKGIRHILFYQLPVFPHFYYEMCNLMQDSYQNKKVGSQSNMTVTVIYSKYDLYQLSSVVGTEKATKMSQSDRKVHMMVTGGG